MRRRRSTSSSAWRRRRADDRRKRSCWRRRSPPISMCLAGAGVSRAVHARRRPRGVARAPGSSAAIWSATSPGARSRSRRSSAPTGSARRCSNCSAPAAGSIWSISASRAVMTRKDAPPRTIGAERPLVDRHGFRPHQSQVLSGRAGDVLGDRRALCRPNLTSRDAPQLMLAALRRLSRRRRDADLRRRPAGGAAVLPRPWRRGDAGRRRDLHRLRRQVAFRRRKRGVAAGLIVLRFRKAEPFMRLGRRSAEVLTRAALERGADERDQTTGDLCPPWRRPVLLDRIAAAFRAARLGRPARLSRRPRQEPARAAQGLRYRHRPLGGG